MIEVVGRVSVPVGQYPPNQPKEVITMKCPQCGEDHAAPVKFCTACGTPMKEVWLTLVENHLRKEHIIRSARDLKKWQPQSRRL